MWIEITFILEKVIFWASVFNPKRFIDFHLNLQFDLHLCVGLITNSKLLIASFFDLHQISNSNSWIIIILWPLFFSGFEGALGFWSLDHVCTGSILLLESTSDFRIWSEVRTLRWGITVLSRKLFNLNGLGCRNEHQKCQGLKIHF